MENDLITVVEDDDEEFSAIARLIELGRQKSYVTIEDILHFFPEAEQDVEQLEEAFAALMSAGITYIEDSVTEEPSDEELDSRELDEEEPEEDHVLDDLAHIDTDDTIGLYLKEVSRVPLLNAEEEVDLAQRIERGRMAREELARGNNSKNRCVELRLLIEDGWEAREHLITANSRLVISVAKKYMGRGVPFLDLIQEGNIGLIRATKKFDYRRGHKFSTYATWWIRQAVTRAIADQGRTIRVPVHMVDRIRQLYKLTHELEQKLGRAPTNDELAESIGVTTAKVEWMLRVSWLPLSLESPINEDEEDSELGQFVEDQITPTPSQSAYAKLLREKIEEVLETLPPREARILRLRFGLENGHTYTLEEVGQKFGLTRERIRQIEGKALRRLRHPRRSRQLREYL